MNKVAINLYSFFVFLAIMYGAHAWFTWYMEDQNMRLLMLLTMLVASLLSIFYLRVRHLKLSTSHNVVMGLLMLFFANLFQSGLGILSLISIVCQVYILWVLFSEPHYKSSILKRIVNLLAIVLVPGIVLHLYLFITNTLLPGIPIVHPRNNEYIFFNYIVLLKGIGHYESDGLRFQSVFLEPGYLGTLLAFLLYSIKFDFAKYKSAWVLLISLFLSLSLAGYILCYIGYMLCLWSERRKFLRNVIPFFLLIIFFEVSINYNNGNNYIYENIIERLELDEDKGIKGNNRVGAGTDFYFQKSLSDGSFLLGIGAEKIIAINGGEGWTNIVDYDNQIRGAGYKIFILRNGLICAMLWLLCYYYLSKTNKRNKIFSYGYLFIIVLAFVQASYPNSYAWLIPFILGVQNCTTN